MNCSRMRGKKGDEHCDPPDRPRHHANPRRGRGTYANDRPPVLGVLGRETGQLRWRVVDDTRSLTLCAFVEQFTQPEALVYTDELTLRRQTNRTQLTQLVKSGMQGNQVQARFQSKMVQTGRLGEQLQLDISAESSKQAVSLRSDGLRGRVFERSVLLQRFMERFDIPPFAVDRRDLVAGEGGLTGHQIVDAARAVFVGEDLLDQRQREIDTEGVRLAV
jgi:ISXO2-like transposase domain